MKIITNDYGCGTSSSILDYNTDNVVVCSKENHKHVFNLTGEDLFFVGHDFLSYLWDSQKYRQHWKNYSGKKHIWCFEKIDCIVPHWRANSHASLGMAQQFTDSFFVSDEQDARKYNISWLPQWASSKFYEQRKQVPSESRMTFSGQAGVIGYAERDALLGKLSQDQDIKDKFYVSNTTRSKSWEEYITNFLNHKYILNPLGNFKGFNTRTYEALTSGRILIQQIDPEFIWHKQSLEKYPNVFFFETFEQLKEIVINLNGREIVQDCEEQFKEHNLHVRMNLIK